MPWSQFKDADDAIHDWLKSQYAPYRAALPDPTVLPLEDEIDWDTVWTGIHETSFAVLEDISTHMNLGLGVHNIEFDGLWIIRSTFRWMKEGKPPILKNIREFVTKTLHSNINPVPTVLRTDAGITQMVPVNSRIYLWPPDNAQADYWILEVRVATKVLNSIV